MAAVFPLSGELSSWGRAALAGAEMALTENSSRLRRVGLAVSLVPVDETVPERMVARSHLLAADSSVVAVLGHLDSATAIPASEIYGQGDLPLLAPSATAPEFTRRGLDNVFRYLPDDGVQAERLAEFAFDRLLARRVFVFHDGTVHGQGLADSFTDVFQDRGGRLVGYLAVGRGEELEGGLALEVESRRPDVLFFGGLFPDACRLVSALAGVAPRVPFLGGDGLNTPAFGLCAALAGREAYAASFLPPSGTGLDRFRRRFQAFFGYPPESVSVYVHDAARCLLDAVENAARLGVGRPTRMAVARLLRETSCHGLALSVSFAADGRNRLAGADRVFVRAMSPRPTVFHGR